MIIKYECYNSENTSWKAKGSHFETIQSHISCLCKVDLKNVVKKAFVLSLVHG